MQLAPVGPCSTGRDVLLILCSLVSFRPQRAALSLSLSLSCKAVSNCLQRPIYRSSTALDAVVDGISRPLHAPAVQKRSLLHDNTPPEAAFEHGTSLQLLQGMINRNSELPTLAATEEANRLLSGDLPLSDMQSVQGVMICPVSPPTLPPPSAEYCPNINWLCDTLVACAREGFRWVDVWKCYRAVEKALGGMQLQEETYDTLWQAAVQVRRRWIERCISAGY